MHIIAPSLVFAALLGLGLGTASRAAESPAKAAPPTKAAPKSGKDTQPALPIPPDHAKGGGTMQRPDDASMGYVDPKYKTGKPTTAR